MFRTFKLGLSLIKYGFNLKQNIVACALFFVLGVIMEISSGGTNFVGCFYCVLVGMFALQMIVSTDLSTLVASSKLQRSLQTSVPVLTTFIIEFVLLTCVLGVKFFYFTTRPENRPAIIESMVMFSVMCVLMFIYCGSCYKYFLVTTIVFFIGVVSSTLVVSEIMKNEIGAKLVEYGFFASVAICYGTLILGTLLQYGMTCLFYKKPLSKYAFKGLLQKM